MDAKEAKKALKSAREAIKNKDFKEALKLCKGVLKHDKGNYNAWVFAGVASDGLEQPDQAVMAYKKATEVDPQQLLAWQGLSGFYEKAGKAEYNEDLIVVYEELIRILDSDATKKLETALKMAELLHKIGDTEKCVDTYKLMLSWASDDTAKLTLWDKIIRILQPLKSPSEQHIQLLGEGYENVVKLAKEADDDLEKMWSNYITHLLKNVRDFDKVKQECEAMAEKFANSPYPLEVHVQICLDQCTDVTKEQPNIAELEAKLSAIKPNSSYLKLLQGFHKLQGKEYTAARTLLREGLSTAGDSISGHVFLVFTLQRLHDSQALGETVDKALKLLGRKSVQWTGNKTAVSRRLQVAKAQALTEQGQPKHLTQALNMCTQLKEEDETEEIKLCMIYCYLGQENWEAAQQVLSELSADGPSAIVQDATGWSHFLQGETQAAQDCLLKALECGAGALCRYHLARVYWVLGKQEKSYMEKCFRILLEAAKLDPFYGPCFLYLGHYYNEVLKDKSKARRCYQKSYDLDPDNEAAGAALVDAMVALQEEKAASDLLSVVTAQASAGSAKWAYLRLGLQLMKEGDPTKAVASLQAALRADPNDKHGWECLGEAYMSRGSLSASLKAFTRATELDPDAMYCLYQIASIKQSLGSYPEALQEYQSILSKSPDYVPALKGLGETHLFLARAALNKFLHGRAVDHCQQALLCLTRAASCRPDLSCVWKLLGDACTVIQPVPAESVCFAVPSKLLGLNDTTDGTSNLSKQDAIAVGARCYGMALKQLPDCASLWHDLGVNYWYQSQQAGETSARQLAAKAVQVLQKATTLNPKNNLHWTALGVVTASEEVNNPGLAQHCFIKSINMENNNVIAWTNLGTLYLKNNEIELAHEAFKVAQSLEPSYVASWIGQSLIAEAVGHDDAMDLFRHTTELGNHAEGSIGYAHWVCSTLQDKSKVESELFRYCIEHMAAVPAASDALAKYTDRVKTNATAYNMLGLLLERQGLYTQAAKALCRAVVLLDAEGPSDRLEFARVNYARVLCSAGQYKKSVKQYQALGSVDRFEDILGMALALFKAELFPESFQAYEKALAVAPSVEAQSQIHAAMGMVAYKSGDVNEAKSAFFRCAEASPPSVPGLKALCSLGLLQKDLTLAMAVLKEFAKVGDLDDAKDSADLAFLTATMSAMQGKIAEGRNHLLKAVHTNPTRWQMWQALGLYTVQWQTQQCKTAARCGQVALSLLDNIPQKTLASLLAVTSVGGGLHSRNNPSNNAFSIAQKSLHLYPDSMSNWCSLLSACQAQYVVMVDKQPKKAKALESFVLSLAAHLMAKVEGELQHGSGNKAQLQALHLWSVRQYIIMLLTLRRVDQAKQFLTQATWLYESDPLLRSLSAALEDDLKGIRSVALDTDNPFAWQVLTGRLRAQGLMKEVSKTLKQHIKYTGGQDEKLATLVQLTFLAYEHIVAKGSDAEKWQEVFNETCEETLEMAPLNTPTLLMQAVLEIRAKNERLARRQLQQVLSATPPGGIPDQLDIARRHLLAIYHKKEDETGKETLVQSALDDGDADFMAFYEEVTSEVPGVAKEN